MPEEPVWTPVESSQSIRRHLVLGSVFAFALLLRCSYLWGQAGNNPLFDAPIMDEAVHHQWATQIAAGDGLGTTPYFRAPLYYYLRGSFTSSPGRTLAWGDSPAACSDH